MPHTVPQVVECRKFRITLVSADDLPDIRHVFRMKVYAKVSIGGKPKTTRKTPVDKEGETNPRWNFPIEYTISESTVRKPGVNLNIKLICKRTRGDKPFGEVNVAVKDLFDMRLEAERSMSYPVDGAPSGRLNILYSFGETIWVERVSVEKPRRWRNAVGNVFFTLVENALMIFLDVEGDNDDGDGDDDDAGEGCDDEDDQEGEIL